MDIFEKQKRKFFAEKLKIALDEWKIENKDKGGTDEMFARLIGKSKNMIPRYKKSDDEKVGAYPEDKTLKSMCRVLGKSENYFTPTTESELYKWDADYMTSVLETHAVKYCKEIDLDLIFLSGMKRMFGEEFGDIFPKWTPIARKTKRNLFEDNDPYCRADASVISRSAQVGRELDVFQFKVDVDGDRRNIIFGEGDLRFIKEVQDKAKEYIEFLFSQRCKEMDREVDEANKRYWKPNPNGDGMEGELLKYDELNEIDKYRNLDYFDLQLQGRV